MSRITKNRTAFCKQRATTPESALSRRLPFNIHRDEVCTVLKAVCVGIGCYLGSAFEPVYPQLDTAILFPPYAVLAAALILSPVRNWWIYLLASALGNYLPHRQGAPASWVLLTEIANFTRALLAAGCLRYLIPKGPRLDTLQGAVAFLIFAVVVGPFVAALVGAGIVVLHVETTDYWLVWQAWFLSNALTGVTLLPMIMVLVRGAIPFPGPPSWQRGLEASALMIGIFAVSIVGFAVPYTGSSNLPARLYAPLPFLFWAAVRFGPGGTSFSLLIIASVAIWGTLHEYGPFVAQSPANNLLSLQLFLLVVSMLNLILAALTTERQIESNQRMQREIALQASYDRNKELTGQLITAQETERARIARQLHDDVNQQLAALSIALSGLKRRLPETANDAQSEAARLQQQTINLSEEIRNLSHELHPGVLRHAGLAAALKGCCAEFGSQYGIEVSVDVEDNLEGLPADVALCRYRVAQEALHNTAMHAHARHVWVALSRTASVLELTVSDDGCGFNPPEAKQTGGLGLLSIDERVRLVRGTLRIESRPHWGTEVCASVPLQFDETAQKDSWELTQAEELNQSRPCRP
jgi:two-component system sensor histidine kinase UhpB